MAAPSLSHGSQRSLLPTRPRLFVGRSSELTALFERLKNGGEVVPLAESPGSGKSALALEFAHRYFAHFDGVYWVSCSSGDLTSLASQLKVQVGRASEGGVGELVSELKEILSRKRCLLILDDVNDESAGPLLPYGFASTIVTTRRRNLRCLRSQKPFPMQLFNDDECFDVFARIIKGASTFRRKPEYLRLFERLERLPLALSVTAGLMKLDLRYTIRTVTAKLPEDLGEMIGIAVEALTPEGKTLLTAMAACAAEGFRFALAGGLTDLNDGSLREALDQLVARFLVEEIDSEQQRYRMHCLVREVAEAREVLGYRHAEAVLGQFKRWETEHDYCEQDSADFQLALDWALANEASVSRGFPDQLGFLGFRFYRRAGHFPIAMQICERMQRAALGREDNYSLQAWYGNEALILKDWGRTEESLALYGQQQAICLDLGQVDGLQTSYESQVQILELNGRLEEAWQLNERQEAMCIEIGNRVGLGHCYWSWGLLARDLGYPQSAYERLNAALDIFTELDMTRERDAVAVELGL